MTHENWWARTPKGTRRVLLVAGVAGILLVVAAAIGLTLRLTGQAVPSSSTSAAPSRAGHAPHSEEVEDGQGEGDHVHDLSESSFDVSGLQLQRDEFGMITMPETKSAAEAAAAAAVMAWTVDYTALTRTEYFERAIPQLTQPSPTYVGGLGQINTGFIDRLTGETTEDHLDPAERMSLAVRYCGLQHHMQGIPCIWWTTANNDTYDRARADGMFSVATPLLVMSDEEMLEWSPNSVPSWPQVDLSPDTEGATFTWWWVLSEVVVGSNERGLNMHSTVQRPLHVGVWCDAPADGGLCGVMFMDIRVDMPDVWPTRS